MIFVALLLADPLTSSGKTCSPKLQGSQSLKDRRSWRWANSAPWSFHIFPIRVMMCHEMIQPYPSLSILSGASWVHDSTRDCGAGSRSISFQSDSIAGIGGRWLRGSGFCLVLRRGPLESEMNWMNWFDLSGVSDDFNRQVIQIEA